MKKSRDMKAEKKIFDFLLDHDGKKMYPAQIARMSGASVSTTYQVLERLKKEKKLKEEKLGNLNLVSLDLNDSLIRQNKVTRTVELLKPLIEKLKDFSRKIILFGSAAEGTDRVESDVDLFILSNEKSEVRRIISKANIDKKIQAVVKNSLEFSEIREKDRFFYEELKKGRVLWERLDER